MNILQFWFMLETDTVAGGQEHWCLFTALSHSPSDFRPLCLASLFLIERHVSYKNGTKQLKNSCKIPLKFMYSLQNRKLERALCKENKRSAVKLSCSHYSVQIELSVSHKTNNLEKDVLQEKWNFNLINLYWSFKSELFILPQAVLFQNFNKIPLKHIMPNFNYFLCNFRYIKKKSKASHKTLIKKLHDLRVFQQHVYFVLWHFILNLDQTLL